MYKKQVYTTPLKIYLDTIQLDISKFARLLKYSQCHISQVVNGKTKPSLKLASKIDKATGGKISINSWIINE